MCGRQNLLPTHVNTLKFDFRSFSLFTMRQFLATLILLFASLMTVQAQSVGHGADIDAQINSRQAQKQQKKPQAEPRKPAEPSTSEAAPTGTRMKMVLRKIRVRKKTPEELAETRTKITKGVHHEQGFRIQVYTGGNTRVARQQAERAGQKVKAAMPNQPVYVHFYSPRWSCRVGNFKTYNSALGTLRQIRRIGYKGAIIIRSTIAVKDVEYVDNDVALDE